MAKTIEQQIAERFEHLVPRDGFPADPSYPAPSTDRDYISSATRVAASVPLINTDLSKSTDRANAIADAICKLEQGERGTALIRAVGAFEAADDGRRHNMLVAAIKDVSRDHEEICIEFAHHYRLDGRVEAAAFLNQVYRSCNKEQKSFIDHLSKNNALAAVFREAKKNIETSRKRLR